MGAEWNLAKSRFWPFFLTILYVKIVYNIVWYFICRFFFTINSPIRWVNQSVQKELRKFMYGNHDSINFVSFCNQKRYFELTSYGDCKKEIYDLCYHFIQYYINLEYHHSDHTYVFQIRLKMNSWKNCACNIWNRRTCVMVF